MGMEAELKMAAERIMAELKMAAELWGLIDTHTHRRTQIVLPNLSRLD